MVFILFEGSCTEGGPKYLLKGVIGNNCRGYQLENKII